MSHAPCSTQAYFDQVFVFDLDVITLLSKTRIQNLAKENPNHRPFQDFAKKLDRLITDIIFKQTERMAVGIRYQVVKMIQEHPALRMFTDHWAVVKKFLKLINRKARETGNVAIVVLCEYRDVEAEAELIVSSLMSEISVENIFTTERHSEKEVIKDIKERFGGKCGVQIVSSKESILAIAQELGLSGWKTNSNQDFEILHDKWKECWFPEERKQTPFSNPKHQAQASVIQQKSTRPAEIQILKRPPPNSSVSMTISDIRARVHASIGVNRNRHQPPMTDAIRERPIWHPNAFSRHQAQALENRENRKRQCESSNYSNMGNLPKLPPQ